MKIMDRPYNSQSFIPEEVALGLHTELIKTLLNYNKKSPEFKNDIHIWSDGYCTIVDWATVPINRSVWDSEGHGFEYVSQDEFESLMDYRRVQDLPDDNDDFILNVSTARVDKDGKILSIDSDDETMRDDYE